MGGSSTLKAIATGGLSLIKDAMDKPAEEAAKARKEAELERAKAEAQRKKDEKFAEDQYAAEASRKASGGYGSTVGGMTSQKLGL